jgi:hypothetical protein
VFVDDVRQGNLRFDRETRTITLTAWSGSTGAPLFIWTQDRDVVLAIGKSGSYLRIGLKPSADLREYEVVTMCHDKVTWPTRQGRDACPIFIDK